MSVAPVIEDGLLLYVGVSNVGPRRISQHAIAAAWWPRVATITIEHAPNRDSALQRERHAIEHESPAFNRYLRRRAA